MTTPETDAALAQECGTTAKVLALIEEVDTRKLYLPAGYPSMYMFCVHELHMSEDVAFKRIRAARAARRFPAIFERVAGGQLHLSAVVMLAPYLREATVDELLAAATHKTKVEIELFLAARFPRPGLPTKVQAMAVTLPACQVAPGPLGMTTPGHGQATSAVAADRATERDVVPCPGKAGCRATNVPSARAAPGGTLSGR